jgi:allantoin racemase
VTVILINPNSTDAMTQSALTAARTAAPRVQFEGWTSVSAPKSIEGPQDGARAVPPLLDLVRKASDAGADAIIIACFDDTGLAEAQAIAACPVIGIGQASYVIASLLAGPTAVITTVEAAVPVIKANIKAQGQSATVRHVEAADVPVLTLTNSPAVALAKFSDAAQKLPADTVNLILGCSGAVSIKRDLQADLHLNVIDGVTAAARLSRVFLTDESV